MLAIAAMMAAGCDEAQIPDGNGNQNQDDTTHYSPFIPMKVDSVTINPDNNKKAYQLIIKSQIRDIMITTGADRYYGANVRPVAVE